MGAVRFGIPRKLVLWARDTLGFKTFIETGTNKAETTLWAADHFSRVITIEGMRELYEAAASAHANRSNITFLHGDSGVSLVEILEKLDEPALIWLDAHWCGQGTFESTSECPLIAEIDAINRSKHEHMILVDDARLFVAPPPPPHKAADWPDLLEVAGSLRDGHARYAVIYEDVIVAVPATGRVPLVEFIRACPPMRTLGLRAEMFRVLRRLGLLPSSR